LYPRCNLGACLGTKGAANSNGKNKKQSLHKNWLFVLLTRLIVKGLKKHKKNVKKCLHRL
jgi:hypothetical protein